MRKQFVLTRVSRGARLFGSVGGTINDTDIDNATKYDSIQELLFAIRGTTREFARGPGPNGLVDAMWTIGVVEEVSRLDFVGPVDTVPRS